MTNRILAVVFVLTLLVIISTISFRVRFALGKYFYTDIQIQTPIIMLIEGQHHE